jgi:hypothetical protein
MNFIKDIKEKQKTEADIENLRQKRDNKVEQLQNVVFMKQIDEFVETSKELESKQIIYERKRKEQQEKERVFFEILDKADVFLQQKGDFNAAIKEYHIALDLLNSLGSGWESYSDTIKATINTIKNLKEEQIQKEYQEKRKEEAKKTEELKFQQTILTELQKERDKIKQKELKIELKEEELEYVEERRESAFKALDDAQKFIFQGDLDNAIIAYQTAGNIFAGIQWNDELPLIEETIQELENRKKQEQLNKQKSLEKSIKLQKEEQKFQDLISKKLATEREALRKREIILKEQKKELEYRETRRKEAFDLLKESQNYLEQGNYDKVIEIYNNVTSIFAQIQWYDELELIGNAIIEIENKKRQEDLERQKQLQLLLEKEKEEREFQKSIFKAMEDEKRIYQEMQEEAKEEAFSILDKAQNFLSLGKFDMAIDQYREVAKRFAQIGWKEEIPLILQSIERVQAKKKEKDLWKKTTMQKALEEEKETRRFIAKIQEEREREKQSLELKQLELEEAKKISDDSMGKQEKAFNYIEQADNVLNNADFDSAIELYQKAITLLSTIGWSEDYLTLLNDSIEKIKSKNLETEQRKIREREQSIKQMEEDKKFERKV